MSPTIKGVELKTEAVMSAKPDNIGNIKSSKCQKQPPLSVLISFLQNKVSSVNMSKAFILKDSSVVLEILFNLNSIFH